MKNLVTIKVPNNYLDYCADASIADTYGWLQTYGEHYRKCKDEARNLAWLEAVVAITDNAKRGKHATEFTVSPLAAQVVADDLNYFATKDLDGHAPFDKPRFRRYAQQCAKARSVIVAQLNQEVK